MQFNSVTAAIRILLFLSDLPDLAFPPERPTTSAKWVKTQYDYSRGVATELKTKHVITRTEHNDPFDRITRITAGYGLSGSNTSITDFTYPTAFSNTTTVSKPLDDTRWLAYRDTYDGFGRAVGAAAAEDGNPASFASFTIFSSRVLDGLDHRRGHRRGQA